MKAIAAVNNKGFLGKNGKMMWRSSEDFKHFKKLTTENILILGRITFEHDLQSRPLPNRIMHVIGKIDDPIKEEELWHKNVYYHKTIWDAVKSAAIMSESLKKDIWCIGGASIYEQMWPLITELHLSKINDDQEGDVKLNLPENFRGEIYTYSFEVNQA